MAWIEKRERGDGGVSARVLWRLGGTRDGARQVETFAAGTDAQNLARAVSNEDEASIAVEQAHRLRSAASRLIPDTAAADDAHVHALTDQILAVVDGLTVDALTDPQGYPPKRQLAILHEAVTALTGQP